MFPPKKPLKPLKPLTPQRPAVPVQQRSRYQSLIFDADRLFKDGDTEAAFLIYQQASQEAPPGENHAFAQLCQCYRRKAKAALKAEQHIQVIEWLEAMLKVNGNRPNLKGMDFKVLAESYMTQGRLDEAENALTQALALSPDLSSLSNLIKTIKTERVHRQLKGLQ